MNRIIRVFTIKFGQLSKPRDLMKWTLKHNTNYYTNVREVFNKTSRQTFF